MKGIKPLIPYNLCCLMSLIFILNWWELNSPQCVSQLTLVIIMSAFFQFAGLLISHLINYNSIFRHKKLNIIVWLPLIMVSILTYHTIIVLLGAPFISDALKTFHLSCLLCILTIPPLLVFTSDRLDEIFTMRCNIFKSNDHVIRFITYNVALTTLGAWIGAFPIVLDWMQEWQEWPVSCCVGAIIGHIMSQLTCLYLNFGSYFKLS